MTLSRRALSALAVAGTVALLASCAVQTAPDDDAPADDPAAELTSARGFDMDAGTIRVGVMTALSGPLAATAAFQVVGQQAYWDMFNAEGGIAGEYQVELVPVDNQYNPQLAVQEYQKVKDDVVMFSGVLGDPSNEALLPIIERDDMVVAPSTQSARFANNANLLPTFTSYQTNAWNTLSYLHQEGIVGEDSVVCGLNPADQGGEAREIAIEYGAEQLGYTVGPFTEMAASDAAFTAQVQTLKDADCDVVVFGGFISNLPSVVAAATQLDFDATWMTEFFALSDTFRESEIADYLEEHFYVTGLAGDLDDTSIEGIGLLTEQIAPTEVNPQHVYGFMQARGASVVLEKAIELGDLSGPGIMEALNQIDTISYLGLNGDVTLGPVGERRMPDTSAIFRYDRTKSFGLSSVGPLYKAPEGNGPGF